MTNEELERLEALARAATQGEREWACLDDKEATKLLCGPVTIAEPTDGFDDYPPTIEIKPSDALFIAACDPKTILSLIQRVKEAEFDATTTRASVVSYQRGYADGRAEGLEEAAKVADYHTSVDSASISQAIRALGEKA